MHRVKTILLALAISLGVVAAVPMSVGALDVVNGAACSGQAASNPLCAERSGAGNKLNQQIKNITNVILFLLGAVAVIVIIIGGLMYVVSAGDPGKAKTAKDTILYAVIGLVVALFAGAIVNFVVANVG